MKLEGGPLDDILQELQYLADQDGRWHAKLVRHGIIGGYRGLKATTLLARHYPWRTEQPYPEPELGCESFNLALEESARGRGSR